MNKKFAIIKTPTILNPGRNTWDTPRTWVIPTRDWHEYEKVCGIPLVNEIKFFDFLKAAKENFTFRNVSVIVELEFDHNKLTSFCKIHEFIDSFPEKLPFWKCRTIANDEASLHALDEVNRQYKLADHSQPATSRQVFRNGH